MSKMTGGTLPAFLFALVCSLSQLVPANAAWPYADPAKYPDVPTSGPLPAPPYMVDNTKNYYGVAPDKGNQTGPVWKYSGSLDNYISNLKDNIVIRGGYGQDNGTVVTSTFNSTFDKRQDTQSSYWLTSLGPLGAQPLAGDGYQFFRDVVKDFKADNTGASDASEAINAAVSSWSSSSANGDQTRCGKTCGNTFTQGAIVYFPPGKYKICTPVIQYYYTQFIGDVNDPPTIIGCDTFSGIALFDTDPYNPGEAGNEWYVNQNQFFRHIRNFIFDLTDMPDSTDQNDQPLVPTGIHWQVAQATTLQNLVFNMPKPSNDGSGNSTTAVGIFMENGSGGFVSNLTFNGGNIGWRAGSQQYTARNLKFNGCLTAVQMVWDWGFNWQGIEIDGGAIGFNISGFGGPQGQGIGSISLIDSTISNVPVGILTIARDLSPNIVLDNTVFMNVDRTIQADGGDTLLTGSPDLWALGKRYNGSVSSDAAGDVDAPMKAKGLLDSDGKLFVRERPQYEELGTANFLVATTYGNGCSNDGTGDQTNCINTLLQEAASRGSVAYFPAGIYRVGGTVFIPTGSRVQGSSWSQIMGAGYYFGSMQDPHVMVQVGNAGDVGNVEIVEMLFSVQGSTAGAILMEWNTAAATQGSAAMWDSHFRVGGGKGTDLDMETCPKNSMNDYCIASSLMFHVTPQASGYFENVWAWVADHDNDVSLDDQPDSTSTQLAIFGARGMLIESQGPSWFYGTGSEHSVFYNYQLSSAKNVYMGHIQTEAPYFQPDPGAPAPFGAAKGFPNDPDFSSCNVTADVVSEQCRYSWGLRIIDSANVTLHSAGLYSFFNDFYQDCIPTHNCQERILEVKGSEGVVIYNLFTIASIDVANGIDGSMILQSDSNQRGFTTETSVWLPLPGDDNVDIVYVGPEVFTSPVVSCASSCLLIFPTSHLTDPTTIMPSAYITPFEYGGTTVTTINGAPATVFVTHTTTITISIAPITASGIQYSNVNITTPGRTPITIRPSVDVPPSTINLPDGNGGTTSRVVPLPPWPLINIGPQGSGINIDPGSENNTNTGSLSSSTTFFTPIRSTITVPSSKTTTITFPGSTDAITLSCPATTAVSFNTPVVTVQTQCNDDTTSIFEFDCPTTKLLTFLAATTATVSVDCTLITAFSTGQDLSTSSSSLTSYTTYPPYVSVTPVTTSVPPTPVPTDDGVIIPCTAYFFDICIHFGELNVFGWFLGFPPGIYPPGPPPPNIKPPPDYTFGSLPPWPKITIDNNNQITTDSEPECETETASLCSTTTTFYGTITSGRATITTSSAVSSHCETVTGCSLTDSDTETSTQDIEGTQTVAPIETWIDETWQSTNNDPAFSSSVFAALSAALASASYSGQGSVITFTNGPTAGPTCASGTECGGHLCTGYWCTPNPTGYPPGYQDPKDPSSGGYSAPTTAVGGGGGGGGGSPQCTEGLTDCSNPSLEDGDGLCTCQSAGHTVTVTPPGGPGNLCPTSTCTTTATNTGGGGGGITPAPSYPTISNAQDGHASCYQTPSYLPWVSSQAQDAVTNICNMGNTLQPAQTAPYVEAQSNNNGPKVFAQIGWAADQSGCQPKSAFPLGGDRCLTLFDVISEDCPPNPDTPSGEGGGYVYKYEYGCILVTLGADADAQ